ncbi:hypothetical protein [Pseudodesulfovibrio portus]|uniref:Uncharacterized protein n=1 Tax=Pseudodesulfovibrio portus TaxID=231439 RepID=A0ABN6RTW2_9BACT|nr:hypothetical protein [Pseudodesulfovibrio portus]BDQ34564.1 hypothetical protein JCM14722_21060 [Pseudodesulfovibrio portus]
MSKDKKYLLNRIWTAAILVAVTFLLIYTPAEAAEIVDVSPVHCRHGLHQPDGGKFAVFVFCDDALGTQLGIIYTQPGVGPVEPSSEWSNGNRFWQEGEWVYDAINLLWSPSGDYLYVTTEGVYGFNGFYELDLRKRAATKLLSGSDGGDLRIEAVENGFVEVNGRRFRMKD